MRSQLFSIGLITIAMSLSMCQLIRSSPARPRRQVEIGEKEEVVSNNEHTTEDPIINEAPSDTMERMELNSRPKPIQRMRVMNVTAANSSEIETTLKPNITGGSLNTNDSISELENVSVTETIGQEGGTNVSNKINNQIPKEVIKELADGVMDNQPPKLVPQNAPLVPRHHGDDINSNMMDEQNNRSINEQAKESSNVQSSLKRNLETKAEPNADLMGHNETELQSNITAENGESFHTHSNDSNVVNQSETENHGNVENDHRDKFLLKHNHLAQLLFHSSFLGPLSQPTETLKENQDEISSEMGVDELSRMITEPEVAVEMREDKNDGFQDRSDANLSAGRSENNGDQPIDRSLEIDISHLDEDRNFEERTRDEDLKNFHPTPTENVTEQERTNIAEENDDKSKGFFDFLKSFFF